MKRQIGKICCLLLAVLVLWTGPVGAWAAGGRTDRATWDYWETEGWPAGPELASEAAYLIDLQSGAVLWEKNSEETLYPASITKVLTALLIVENCNLDDTLTFSRNSIADIEEDGLCGLVTEGDQMTVRDGLYLMLLRSSNEAAYALAEHMSGSVEAFAEEMNQKAQELGAEHSHFANPHGLFDENHYTTAEDMARIYWGAIQNETFLEIDSTPSYSFGATTTQPDGFTVEMLDQMLVPGSEYYNEDVKAGKTGYIQMAQNTLVTYGVRDGRELICVTMKAETRAQSYEDTEALLNYGFENFTLYQASEQVDTAVLASEVSEELGAVQAVSVDPEAGILLPNGVSLDQATSSLNLDGSGENGIYTAQLTYTWQGQEIASVPVHIQLVGSTAGGDELENFRTQSQMTDEGGFLSGLETWQLAVLAAMILLVIALVVLMILRLWLQHQRKKRREARRRRRERY